MLPGDIIQIGEQSLVFHLETEDDGGDEIYVTQSQMTVREVRELTCWFLLLDIENFVQLSGNLAPDELGRMVGAWIAESQRVIEKHGGTVSKFLGDGLLAYWNTQFTGRSKVADALNALRLIQDRRQPAFRWGLHFGKAVFGAAAAVGELTTLGQDLNYLFRMERLAATQRFPCLISQAAQAEMESLGKGRPLGAFPLKGFEGEHAFFSWEVLPPASG